MKWQIFYEAFFVQEGYKTFLEGLKNTAIIAVLGLFIGFFIGALIAVVKITPVNNWLFKILRAIGNVYVAVFRGTPIVVQLLLIHYVLFPLAGINIPALAEGFITFGLNSGAYISEIMRGGILSVDKGQMEAARSLGLSYAKSMQKIILPQAVRICLPSLVNQFIITLKDSTILYAIGLSEVMYNAKIYVGRTMESFATYTWVAVFFLLIVTVLSFISRYVERRMNA